jgi:hypothetical protein
MNKNKQTNKQKVRNIEFNISPLLSSLYFSKKSNYETNKDETINKYK